MTLLSEQNSHIGIIPDGNRRYAKINNLSLYEAYKSGIDKVVEVSKSINHLFNHISIFVLSCDNLHKRSQEEINCIFHLIIEFQFKYFLTELNRDVFIIGSNAGLPQSVIDKKEYIHKQNKKNKKKLYLFFNYSSSMDIDQTLENNNTRSYKELLNCSMLSGIPNFSIVFRSGDTPRISTFPLLLMNYCNIYFSKKLWPQIQPQDILEHINNDIHQKYGK